MPNCDFYATLADHERLLRWLFADGACHVFELNSDVEQPLKQFHSADEVLSQFNRTHPTGEKRDTVYLQLYVQGASPPFVPRRVRLNPETCNGATFRYTAEGWGLIQLYLGTVTARGLNNSHTNHNSQKRAEAWVSTIPEMGNVGAWDFKKISAFSSYLNQQIKKFSVAKICSRPILPGALEPWREGVSLLPYSHEKATVTLYANA
ncbi:MAG: hypothetical protein FWC42_07630 [Proteobacteria bacterium]|nr:hypothetical protein [Pseudomonadota bacterium]